MPKNPNKKTGLGSSAALTVSLLTSLIIGLNIMSKDEIENNEQSKMRLHVYCQILNAFI